ncbi:hypothetical protein M5689_023481 [Euphorbia peplus]|nr:hypothetical protein M5689_023481 [Euphorbia peplus]
MASLIISLFMLWILLFSFPASSMDLSSHQRSLVIGESSKLLLSPRLEVSHSPGTEPRSIVFCERVHIHGLSRFRNLTKFSHLFKLTLKRSSLGCRRYTVKVCFHSNASLAIGMCSKGMWKNVGKNPWVQPMSPFDDKILDVRATGPLLESLELSIEGGFSLCRVIFLVIGIVLLLTASTLSKSLAFYYISSMAIGIIVIPMVLFQGVKLLTTGQSNLIAIFMYSFHNGIGSFLLRYVPRLLYSVLEEIGISEDMYYPLGIFLLAFDVLVGAWMGFWAVRKLVLTENGSVDTSTSSFVANSIWSLAEVLILLSSLDTLVAVGSLILGIMLHLILKKVMRFRVWRIQKFRPPSTGSSITIPLLIAIE